MIKARKHENIGVDCDVNEILRRIPKLTSHDWIGKWSVPWLVIPTRKLISRVQTWCVATWALNASGRGWNASWSG